MDKRKMVKLLILLSSLMLVFVYRMLALAILLFVVAIVLSNIGRKLCVGRGESYLQYGTYIRREKRNYATLLVGSTDAVFVDKEKFEDSLDYTEIGRAFDVDFCVIQNFFSLVKEYGEIVHLISLRNVFSYRKITLIDRVAINGLLLVDKQEQNKFEKVFYYLEFLLSKAGINLSRLRCKKGGNMTILLNQCVEEKTFCEERNLRYKVILLTKGDFENGELIQHKLVQKGINTEII